MDTYIIIHPNIISNPNGTDPNGTDPNGTDPNGTDPNGTDPNGTDPNRTDPNRTDPNGTDPNGTDLKGTDPDGIDPKLDVVGTKMKLFNESVLVVNSGCSPTSAEKWWVAIVLGLVFGLVGSPLAYYLTSSLFMSMGGMSMVNGAGANFVGLLVHTIIYICVVRLILW